MEKIALYGCSRGLGFQVAELLAKNPKVELLMVARRIEHIKWPRGDVKRNLDFSKPEYWERVMDLTRKFNPTGIIYFAGGGPYGPFGSKDWKDQEWALNVNFAFPAYLLNSMAAQPGALKKFIAIGSSIAENQPDPNAAMYSATKHALLGLIKTVQREEIPFDLRLFSPGYMDTQLLPPQAWPRTQTGLVKDPKVLAAELIEWYGDDAKRNDHWKQPPEN